MLRCCSYIHFTKLLSGVLTSIFYLFPVCCSRCGALWKSLMLNMLPHGLAHACQAIEEEQDNDREERILAILGIVGTILNLLVVIFVYIYTTIWRLEFDKKSHLEIGVERSSQWERTGFVCVQSAKRQEDEKNGLSKKCAITIHNRRFQNHFLSWV